VTELTGSTPHSCLSTTFFFLSFEVSTSSRSCQFHQTLSYVTAIISNNTSRSKSPRPGTVDILFVSSQAGRGSCGGWQLLTSSVTQWTWLTWSTDQWCEWRRCRGPVQSCVSRRQQPVERPTSGSEESQTDLDLQWPSHHSALISSLDSLDTHRHAVVHLARQTAGALPQELLGYIHRVRLCEADDTHHRKHQSITHISVFR